MKTEAIVHRTSHSLILFQDRRLMNFLELMQLGCCHWVLLSEEGHLLISLGKICIQTCLWEPTALYFSTLSGIVIVCLFW